MSHIAVASASSSVHSQFNFVSAKLLPQHCQAMLDLQERVMDSLCPVQKSFMLPKSRETYLKLLSDDMHHGTGIFTPEGELVGQAWSSKLEAAKPLYGVLPLLPVQAFMAAHKNVCSIHNVMTDPSHRKKGIMGHMLDNLSQDNESDGACPAFIAEIAVGNIGSETGFAHHGFARNGGGVDESDGTQVIFMTKGPQP